MEVRVATTTSVAPQPSERRSVSTIEAPIERDTATDGLTSRLRSTLRKRLGAERYDAWFEAAASIEAAPGDDHNESLLARVVVDSGFTLGIVRKQFDEELRAAARAVGGESAHVEYRVAAEGATPTADVSDPTPAPAPPTPPRAADRPSSDLQGWIEAEGNAAATRLCQALASGEVVASPALFWGPSGGGKTHLLNAIAEGARRRRKKVLAIHAEEFLVSFVESVRSGAATAFRHKHRRVDVLIVDDVQLLIGKERTVEEFRQTIDALATSGALVVLSSDRCPAELYGLGPELASRLAGGISVEAPWPDVSARRRLIQRFAETLRVDISADAVAALAANLTGGAREVRGAVNRLALLVRTFGKPIDLGVALQVADDLNRLATPPVRLADIQRAVCGVFGVDARTLRSDSRAKSVTEPRTLAMWLSRKLTGSPWSEIGDFYGRKSHSTVVAAHKRVETLLRQAKPARLASGELGETIRRIEAALRSA